MKKPTLKTFYEAPLVRKGLIAIALIAAGVVAVGLIAVSRALMAKSVQIKVEAIAKIVVDDATSASLEATVTSMGVSFAQ